MSANQSNLATTGFDYVVALTQDSINAALEEYLYTANLPEVVLCYQYDDNNNPVSIDYQTLVKNANNTDPFLVPDGTAATDPRVQNLSNANFAFAFKARLGLSPGLTPADLPPIVVLQPGQSNVSYTLMFAEFVATEIIYGARGRMQWVNQSQPSKTPWTFTTIVNLNLQAADFTSLTAAAQEAIKHIGDPNMFSIQQLYYDLNKAALESVPSFDKLPSNSQINGFMNTDFISTYWTALHKAEKKAQSASEVFGFGAKQLSATPPSSIAITDLNFFTPNNAAGEKAPLTLNYLCAANNKTLPDTTHAGFGWNWVEPAEASQYDGVAALNSETFINYLSNALLPDRSTLLEYVKRNCYKPSVKVKYKAGKAKVEYNFTLTPGQTPTVGPRQGGVILAYSWSSEEAHDQAGVRGDLASAKLSSRFNLEVAVQGNKMVITQHLIIHFYARKELAKSEGNVVDLQIQDTYTFGVDNEGHIVVSPPQSERTDHSHDPRIDRFENFFLNFNEFLKQKAEWAQGIATASIQDIPAAAVQSFIFPGGNTFSFADVSFSDHQDLVAHITYLAP